MLAISPLVTNNDGREGGDTMATMETNFSIGPNDDFPDFSGGNLLDSIDFDDLFMGMHDNNDDDLLPDLEMDPELLAEFSLSGGEDDSERNNYSSSGTSLESINPNECRNVNLGSDGVESREKIMEGDEDNKSCVVKKSLRGEEIESKKCTSKVNSSFKESDKGKKSSSHNKTGSSKSSNDNNSHQGKRKSKVDWTPELHRRFVQAVEQLGVDKAVPSRILELMGIDCLTRHNIASHLQKYRSHRKHLLAREAEAASWTQKRQMYGVVVGGGKGGANISPWHPPTMGFPPMTTMHHPVRPLHVWGHPSMDLQRMPMWPKQMVPSPPPPPLAWASPPPHAPPVDPSLWHSPHQRVPNAMTPLAPCFPQPLPATRFTAPPVAGIPPHAMYRPEHAGVAPPQPGFESQPSKESIDSAIGDVLAKPWLPLPIGLKPPSVDSVLVELQRQGVPKIPPSCA